MYDLHAPAAPTAPSSAILTLGLTPSRIRGWDYTHPTAVTRSAEVTESPVDTPSIARTMTLSVPGDTGSTGEPLPKRKAGRAMRTTPNRLATIMNELEDAGQRNCTHPQRLLLAMRRFRARTARQQLR